jgi:hypothetical protein
MARSREGKEPPMRDRLAGLIVLASAIVALGGALSTAAAQPAGSPYAAWKSGPSAALNYFPIAVWCQSPSQAARYKAAGINLYVALWKGPTEEQLAALKAAGMQLICDQNEVGLKHKDDPTIVGWMHGDEPDNAQSLGKDKGYGPPIPPEKIIADYQRIRAADPTRPVMLNLGQGVAWDAWHGRGVRTNHPEDYAEYAKGGDIISFDIYPVAHDRPAVQGKLEFVARGVERLVKWTGGRKVVWNCIECTRISSDRKATPAQIKAEVWMAIISGSRGLIYFVHEWKPKFNEHAILDDPENLAAVTAINKEIASLAPVINSIDEPAVGRAEADGLVPASPFLMTVKAHGGATYVFAVSVIRERQQVEFISDRIPKQGTAEVIGEGRQIEVAGGKFKDDFEPYAVHLYRIK